MYQLANTSWKRIKWPAR